MLDHGALRGMGFRANRRNVFRAGAQHVRGPVSLYTHFDSGRNSYSDYYTRPLGVVASAGRRRAPSPPVGVYALGRYGNGAATQRSDCSRVSDSDRGSVPSIDWSVDTQDARKTPPVSGNSLTAGDRGTVARSRNIA